MPMSREIRVGALLLGAILCGSMVIFVIGDNTRAFEEHVALKTVFDDVSGLQSGSPVRMGGLHVGRVVDLGYSDDPQDGRVHVNLIVVKSEAARIRQDSVAAVVAKGLLGDKMLSVTVGSPTSPQVPEGGTIPTEDEKDMMAQLSELGDKAGAVMGNLEQATGTLANKEFRDDVSRSAAALRGILESVQNGNGYASRLLNDEGEAQKLSNSIANLERASANLDRALANVNQVIGRVQTGPGLAHELLYGEETSRTAEKFGNAAEQLAMTLQGIRDGNGLAHDLLFGGGEDDQLSGDLTSMSSNLAAIVADLRAGKGTLGALLVDPSVYEDLKILLGNVQRNQTLRALVRYSIQADEKNKPAEVADPQAGPQRVQAGVAGGNAR